MRASNRPEPVFVISRDAPQYVAALESAGVPATGVLEAREAPARYAGEACLLGEPHLAARALADLPGVNWVQSTWAGIKPLLPAAARGLAVTGVKDIFGIQMAEYVYGYLLARELGISVRAVAQREQRWDESDKGTLEGKTLGVLGTGSIGRVIAERGMGFGLRCLGCSRSGAPVSPFAQVYAVADLHAFLGQLDYLVTVVPDTPATQSLLDAAALRALPRHAVLVNVGRGPLLDDAALVAALERGELAGAVLDVFREEPLQPGHPFWTTPNLVVTGHIAARSMPADVSRIFLENYRRRQAGEPLLYVINAERGY